MAKDRLIGRDGKIVTVNKGQSNYSGDGSQTVDELAGGSASDGSGAGWYEIAAIGDPTGFDSNLSVGDLTWTDGSDILETGDEITPLNETEQSDVTSFSIEMTKAETDVTTLSDTVKRYRASGKVDWSGSLEGITTLGVTDNPGWAINNFIRTIEFASDGSATVSAIDDSDIYLMGRIQKDTSSGEKESFVWVQITLTSSSLGASGEDAQSFSSNFRVATGGAEPTLYIREVA
jgi:hypothetical protein